jgi:hypothetical protein
MLKKASPFLWYFTEDNLGSISIYLNIQGLFCVCLQTQLTSTSCYGVQTLSIHPSLEEAVEAARTL